MEIPNRNWMDEDFHCDKFTTRYLPGETIYTRLARLGWVKTYSHWSLGKHYYDEYTHIFSRYKCRVPCFSIFMPLVFFNSRGERLQRYCPDKRSWIEKL